MVFSDNFNAEPIASADGWQANYASFANFDVVTGSVDLIGTPNNVALTGAGNYVDLDGSTNQGGFLETKNQFSFNANDLVTLSFLVSGNQRSGVDGLLGGFRFFGPAPTYTNISLNGFSFYQEPTYPNPLLIGEQGFVPSGAPWQTYSVGFRALTAGSFSAVIGTNSNDNIGPLIDNVSISVNSVPEPSTWALLILGFGSVGVALRRRRVLALA